MPGATFLPGEQRVRPGTYVRITNIGDIPLVGVQQGVVAALFKASWGPLGEAVLLEALSEVSQEYGSAAGVNTAVEAFIGGTRRVLAVRVGTGGTKATVNLQDGAVTDVVQIDAKYAGTRGNSLAVTVRDALADPAKRELLVFEGTTLRQSIVYDPGAEEAQSLADAVNASGSAWITATRLAAGDNSVADVSQAALTNGADPNVTGADYDAAMTLIAAEEWNVLAVDSEDATVHTAVQAYIDTQREQGQRVMAVVGEPTSVALATRLTNARALNHAAVVYVANGFVGTDGVTREGARAAARVAGRIAAAAVTESLTHAVISGASDLVGALTNAEIEQAIQNGALVFSKNAQRQVQVEYGITTLVAPSADQDDGWKKIRRVRTRDNLIARIVATIDPMIGRVSNSPDGRATLVAAMQGVVDAMIREGALLAGTAREDPANPPAGDSAWFLIEVDDLDSAEKVYLTFGFRFAPPAA